MMKIWKILLSICQILVLEFNEQYKSSKDKKGLVRI